MRRRSSRNRRYDHGGRYDRSIIELLFGRFYRELEAISDYLQIRLAEPHVRANTKALFLSSREQRISTKTVQWLVYKYLEMAGLEAKHYSVHKLRHTAATLMYQTGNVDIRVLKDILGHEQLNTTQIYTHVSDKNMMDAMAQNPLAALTSTGADTKTEDEE